MERESAAALSISVVLAHTFAAPFSHICVSVCHVRKALKMGGWGWDVKWCWSWVVYTVRIRIPCVL